MSAKVLFVCVGNSGRSQMAEAVARHHGLDAESAGTNPAPSIACHAVAVLAEKGISVDGQAPKLLDLARLAEFDVTITMGCGVAESCPSLHTNEDWALDDPTGQPIETFRALRNEIERRVLVLRRELSLDAAPATEAQE